MQHGTKNMINVIKYNWKEIKRVMELSQTTQYTWLEYAQKISNGLSNTALTKCGCGDAIWFVERLNEYAKLPNEYLKWGKNMNDEEISFIEQHREFLITIK